MNWITTPQGWPHATIRDDDLLIGRITLRPIDRGHIHLSRFLGVGVTLPEDHPVYVLAALKVHRRHRRQGHGRSLLEGGARKLIELHGEAWFGLMTDNLRVPVGRTRRDIRACWESVLAAHPPIQTSGGFVLVSAAMGLGC